MGRCPQVHLQLCGYHSTGKGLCNLTQIFISVLPTSSKLLGEATEQMSVKLGQTLSGLLNASFGNAVEIIVGIAALLNGKVS
jgi:calcium/proton exchanger cax